MKDSNKSSNVVNSIIASANLANTIGPVSDSDLINVIKSLKGKEVIRASKLQIEFKKWYCWAFKVLDSLQSNGIVSYPDKFGDRKIIVDNDYFDREFEVVII